MRRVTFDLDVLRSFALGMELGSFAKAADRLGRSTSAVSAQLKKLEQQAGAPVLRKAGRGMALTVTGETMLAYARRLLELNDEAAAALHGGELQGAVRLGLQEDFGATLLPEVLGRFARAHPQVRIEARIARNAELLEAIERGGLDLALAWQIGSGTTHAEHIGEVPLCWIGAAAEALSWHHERGEPLPLVMLEAPCVLRTLAIDALDRARMPWRVAFSSTSLAGVHAAVAAGLGVTLRTPIGLTERLRRLVPAVVGLPSLHSLGLALHRADAESPPAVARLASIIKQDLQGLFALAPTTAATPLRKTRSA